MWHCCAIIIRRLRPHRLRSLRQRRLGNRDRRLKGVHRGRHLVGALRPRARRRRDQGQGVHRGRHLVGALRPRARRRRDQGRPLLRDLRYQTVKDEYAARFDLVWLDKSEAADGQGLVIRTEAAERLGIKTISDLQKHASDLRFASQGQFDERADGLPALEATYGAFDWKDSAIYDESAPTGSPRSRPPTAPSTGRTRPSTMRGSSTRSCATTRPT